MNSPNLILSDAHGIFIPQLWCDGLDIFEADAFGIEFSDVEVCQAGPDHEWYWEAWQSILNNASFVFNGIKWILYQTDGGLWEIPDDFDIEEWEGM